MSAQLSMRRNRPGVGYRVNNKRQGPKPGSPQRGGVKKKLPPCVVRERELAKDTSATLAGPRCKEVRGPELLPVPRADGDGLQQVKPDSAKWLAPVVPGVRPAVGVISFAKWSREEMAWLAPRLLKAAEMRPGDFVPGARRFPAAVGGRVRFLTLAGFSPPDAARLAEFSENPLPTSEL